ncbi:MAG: hypothetical protein K2O16_11905 [Lachnospiraceae bacterium]|nr:hypothetical protein [Lachnospiraceae bacterium]
MSFFKKKWKYYYLCLSIICLYNFYFIFLMGEKDIKYLLYLDFLLALALLLFWGIDFYRDKRVQIYKEQLMRGESIICHLLPDFNNKDLAEHDMQILEGELQEKFQENCELQDYVAKWCHEFKIPLAACFLIEENIADRKVQKGMREQLEKMNQQINSMMLGCRLQSPLFDLQIKKVSLLECVRTSIKNNQFFLIQKGFEITFDSEDVSVYTDPAWLVYVLDQLINNALKYAGNKPAIHIWAQQEEQETRLFVEDSGEGIKSSDIRRIFEKGFTGSNRHNGKYKSTGMGLYMVSKIIDRLGHGIQVESEYGDYTRFCIIFQNNNYFSTLQKL